MAYITQKRVSFSPLDLESRSPALRIAAVAFGTLVLAISSQIAVPMIPVPMIGVEKAVTFGVTPFLIGALIKSALGAAILKAAAR
jgi:biotin transporter BioY